MRSSYLFCYIFQVSVLRIRILGLLRCSKSCPDISSGGEIFLLVWVLFSLNSKAPFRLKLAAYRHFMPLLVCASLADSLRIGVSLRTSCRSHVYAVCAAVSCEPFHFLFLQLILSFKSEHFVMVIPPGTPSLLLNLAH